MRIVERVETKEYRLLFEVDGPDVALNLGEEDEQPVGCDADAGQATENAVAGVQV